MENKIDMSNLAEMMLTWEKIKQRLDEVEAAIRDTVLQIGKTQTVGNVRASYSAGRKSYDYKTAAEALDLPPDVIDVYTVPVTDWRRLCQGLDITDIPFKQSAPSVSVKLLD